ncbi:MAG: carboxynorspermidine decarboxylase, partial [Oscillospiraceae bacterium]|nr:carboxynorspermidine decarboxylase [Oscillospiraceae bacterium]
LDCGFLVTRVEETVHNGMDIAITDTSAACHMPDVLEMPYRPDIFGAGKPGVKKYTYRISSATCLAGDIIGDYSFDEPLYEGRRLIFRDMALYTMVKTNTFNGINLPAIAVLRENGKIEIVRRFGYEDFKNRLS